MTTLENASQIYKSLKQDRAGGKAEFSEAMELIEFADMMTPLSVDIIDTTRAE